MSMILYIILTIFGLCGLIAAHEFGHYIVAKTVGCRVEEFAIGFGPALYKRTCKDGMIFSLRAIPLGGFCQIPGESTVTQDGDDKQLLCNKKTWQQALVFVAGVTVNLLLSFVLCIIAHAIYSGSIECFASGIANGWKNILFVFKSFELLFTGQVELNQISGIIGAVNIIAEVSSESSVVRVGLANWFVLMGYISANLGIANLFPIPALDGGRIFMLGLNKLSLVFRKKPLSKDVQINAVYYTMIAMFILMGVLVIWDIINIFA